MFFGSSHWNLFWKIGVLKSTVKSLKDTVMEFKFSNVADWKPATLLKIIFFIGISSRILPWSFAWQLSEQLLLRTPFLQNCSSGWLYFFKNTFYPEHLHWRLPVFSNKNYFVERTHLVYSVSTIRSFIEVWFFF